MRLAAMLTTCRRQVGGALVLLAVCVGQAWANSAASQPSSRPDFAAPPLRAPLRLRHPLQDKNFFLLSALLDDSAARAVIQSDPALAALGRAKRGALVSANAGQPASAQVVIAPMLWSGDEIRAVGERLRQLSADAGVARVVDGELRPSGLFIRYAGQNDADLLVHAWDDAATAMNRIAQVYGNGQPPRFGVIDSTAYNVKSDAFRRVVQDVGDAVEDATDSGSVFFAAPLEFDLDLLRISHRDEAAREEPMELGINRLPLEHLAEIDWGRFRYSVIVVPGAAPAGPNDALSPSGIMRVQLAARRFKDGLAPLVLVSGGYVNPPLTHFCEAIEMRRALMEDYGIPGQCILVDPHARHTTTNLRNAVRLMYRYGVPMDKPGLITTDRFQSESIADRRFAVRCDHELGYQPVQLGQRIGRTDQEFIARLDSLQADALDPLDP